MDNAKEVIAADTRDDSNLRECISRSRNMAPEWVVLKFPEWSVDEVQAIRKEFYPELFVK